MRHFAPIVASLSIACSNAAPAADETPTTLASNDSPHAGADRGTCEPLAFELGAATVTEDRAPNDEDPVSEQVMNATLSLRYRCGADERTEQLPVLSLHCHGAGCGATATLRGEGTQLDDPDGALTEQDLAPIREGIPEGAVLSFAVVTLAERGFSELTTFDTVSVDGGFDVQRRGEEGPETLASIRPAAP